jgi:hypothetical protein
VPDLVTRLVSVGRLGEDEGHDIITSHATASPWKRSLILQSLILKAITEPSIFTHDELAEMAEFDPGMAACWVSLAQEGLLPKLVRVMLADVIASKPHFAELRQIEAAVREEVPKLSPDFLTRQPEPVQVQVNKGRGAKRRKVLEWRVPDVPLLLDYDRFHDLPHTHVVEFNAENVLLVSGV